MNKVTINKIYINTTNKEGAPLVTKTGKPYTMVVIDTDKGQMSMYCDNKFGTKDIEKMKTVKEGDTLTVYIEQNGNYTNFRLPTRTDILEARIEECERRLDNIAKL